LRRYCRRSTLVIAGSETDVCVLATALDAVDLGFRVVIVEDALCSSSDTGDDALMTLYRNRFSEQIELIKTVDLPLLWRDPKTPTSSYASAAAASCGLLRLFPPTHRHGPGVSCALCSAELQERVVHSIWKGRKLFQLHRGILRLA
jgi:hypothetical protein